MGPSPQDQWVEIDRLVDEAMDLSPENRLAFLERVRSADSILAAEVEGLLKAISAAEGFLAEPALAYSAPMLSRVVERQSLAPGTRFGTYEVTRLIGRGGMATVYLGQDHKHHRAVAIKVLHPELTGAVGPEWFLREIQIAAALHHPHILPLHDSGATGGLLYYVMPYVEGESLRQRLSREERLQVGEAVRIAREVAGALDHAHRQGIIHRDIKPENILLQDGQAVVADFGIARAVGLAGGDGPTEPGPGFGTPAYMSPEQGSAAGTVDGRTDIYALGCVLYEMLEGAPPFAGYSTRAILARHAADPVPPLDATVPPLVQQAVTRALAKQSEDRFATPAEFSQALGGAEAGSVVQGPPRTLLGTKAILFGMMAAVAVLALVVGRHRATDIRLGRRTPVTLEPGLEVDPAISPDGRLVAYAAGSLAEPKIYIRAIDGGNPRPLTRALTPPQRFPSWSPDGKRILFRTSRGIEIVPGLGGEAVPIVEAGTSSGMVQAHPWGSSAGLMPGGWSPDGLRFAYARGDSLCVARPDDGSCRLIARGTEIHSIVWSSDGEWIVYVKGNRRALEAGFFFGNVGESTLWVVRSDGGEPIALTDHRSASASPVWLPSDRALLFISTRDGGRDIYRMTLTSSGRPAATPTRLTTGLNLQAMSISRDGRHLTYSVFTESSNIWELPIPESTPVSISSARPVTSGNQVVEGFDVSADGRWLAFDTDRSGNPDIYRLALPSGEPERLTTDPHEDFGPQWSPDGREIAFHAIRGGVRQVFVMDADGRRQVQVTKGTDDERGPVWAADGTAIYFKHRFNQPDQEVRVVARDRAGRWGPARSVLRGDVLQLAVSPEGDHLAFSTSAGLTVSGPAGENPRVLVPVTDPATQVQPNYVSWSADGKAVYYLALDLKQRATVWSVTLTGSVRRLLVRFDDPGKEWHRFGFRARGKWFYFILGDRQSDIWTTGLSWVP